MHRLLRAMLVALILLPAASAQAAPVVVSEFRFRGPNGAADEYIELRNTSASPQTIGGWQVQGCNSGGSISTRATIDDGVTLPAGGSYLLTNNSASGGPYSGSVPGDQTFSVGITDTGGIRLVSQTTPTPVVEDAVGSSSVIGTARCREGNGLTGLPTAARADGLYSFERKAGGTQDTDDNPADFTGPKASDPQNAEGAGSDDAPSVSGSSPANNASNVAPGATITVTFSEPVAITTTGFALACGGQTVDTVTTQGSPTSATVDPAGDLPRGQSCTLTIARSAVRDADAQDPPDEMTRDATISFFTEGLRLRIPEIQGAGHLSPYDGRPVDDVPGVVTAVSGNGFWMQDTTSDGNDATSQGIFVFRPTTRPAVGDAVTVDGRVQEFRGTAATNLTLTEISGNPVATKTGEGSVTPTLVGADGDEPPLAVTEDDALGDVEIGNVLFDPEEDGLDWHETHEGMIVEIASPEVTGLRNTFGELPIVSGGAAELRTPRGGVVIRDGDMNPERFILENVLAETPTAQVGDSLGSSLVAIADYGFGDYLYYPTSTPKVTPGNLQREVTEPKRANQLAMASMNVENLDGLDDQDKYDELASIVVNNLRSPDILAVEEIQDNDGAPSPQPNPPVTSTDATVTFQRFIAAIAAQGGPVYEYRQIDPEYNKDGGEQPGNIRVGFLYRTDGDVEFVDRPGARYDTPNEVVPTRKGVQLRYSPGRIDPGNAAFNSSRKPLAAEFLWKGRTVFAIANHFNSKGGDDPLQGRHQPPVESSTVQRHKQAAVVAGFAEELLAADPRAAVAVLGDLNDFQFSETLEILEGAGLANLMKTLPENEQYSYVFDGNSQVLDQILVSKELLTPKPEYDSVHVNAEFADQASDHDPQIARLVVRGTGDAK